MRTCERAYLGICAAAVVGAIGASWVMADDGAEATCNSCTANQCATVPLTGGPCDLRTDDCCCCATPGGGPWTCTCQTKTYCTTTTNCYSGSQT